MESPDALCNQSYRFTNHTPCLRRNMWKYNQFSREDIVHRNAYPGKQYCMRECGLNVYAASTTRGFLYLEHFTSCVGCNSVFTTAPSWNFNWSINTSPVSTATNVPSIPHLWTATQTGTFIV